MALKAFVKTLDEIDEKHRDLYVKTDGGYKLDAEGVEDVTALKNALERVKEENKVLKGRKESELSSEEKQELQKLRTEHAAAEEKRLVDEKNWKGLEERLRTDFTGKLTAEQEKAKAATLRLHQTLKENAATAAIAKNKGRVAPLLPHVMGALDVIDENGEFKVVVKDKNGVRYSKENPKEEMSVDELIKNDFLKNEDFMGVFEGNGYSGSGAHGGSTRQNGGGAFVISRADAKDAGKYQEAKAAAAKAGQTLSIAQE